MSDQAKWEALRKAAQELLAPGPDTADYVTLIGDFRVKCDALRTALAALEEPAPSEEWGRCEVCASAGCRGGSGCNCLVCNGTGRYPRAEESK